MKITYLQHSGVVVEYEDFVLIFDYYKGELPEFSRDRKIYVFASHWHQDHFQKSIFDWKMRYPEIIYILSDDIRAEHTADVIMVSPEQDYEVRGLKIKTLRSTDEGVAFFVWIPGKNGEEKRIYHAGDLNWWHWEEEGELYNREMRSSYQKALRFIEGMHVDAAFVPVDPRLGDAYYLGIHYFLEKVDAKAVFPIHMWDHYEICERLLAQPEMENYREKIAVIKEAPQIFRI